MTGTFTRPIHYCASVIFVGGWGGRQEEQGALFAKLEGDSEADAAQREALERWLAGARKQRHRAWEAWRKEQHRKSGAYL